LKAVNTTLRMPIRKSSPRVRTLRASGGARNYPKKYYINYGVESEPGLMAICTTLGDERMYSRLPEAQGEGRALLYVSHMSSDVELREEKFLHELIEKEADNTRVIACDVRGNRRVTS